MIGFIDRLFIELKGKGTFVLVVYDNVHSYGHTLLTSPSSCTQRHFECAVTTKQPLGGVFATHTHCYMNINFLLHHSFCSGPYIHTDGVPAWTLV